ASDQYLAARGLGFVEHERGVGPAVGEIAPVGEQLLAEAFLRGGAQEARRDDLVGVDVRVRQHHGARTDAGEGLHYTNSRGSVMAPRTADAAAVRGLASSVRAPTPWRPSKLRLLVLNE